MTLQTHPDTAGYPCAASLTTPDVDANLHRGAFQAWARNLQVAHVATRQPCGAHGWQWSSQTEAARALGVKDYHITRALNRGTFPGLVMERLGINSAAAGLPPPVDN